MEQKYEGRGGWRGGGRPKISARDKQKVRSLRASDRDWKIIKQILPVIKKYDGGDRKPYVFMLSDEEHTDVSSYIIRGFIEKEQEKKYGPPIANVSNRDVKIEKTETKAEEEAVSIFLELFRIAPEKARTTASMLLEKEKRLIEIREQKKANKKNEDALFHKIDEQLDQADKINEIVKNMLKFQEG